MFNREAAYIRAMTHLIETSQISNDHEADRIEADRDAAIVMAYNRAVWASDALKCRDYVDYIEQLADRAAKILLRRGITSRM